MLLIQFCCFHPVGQHTYQLGTGTPFLTSSRAIGSEVQELPRVHYPLLSLSLCFCVSCQDTNPYPLLLFPQPLPACWAPLLLLFVSALLWDASASLLNTSYQPFPMTLPSPHLVWDSPFWEQKRVQAPEVNPIAGMYIVE
jgi:hypothetical protein